MVTKLVYLDDFDVIAGGAAVVSISKHEDGRSDVVLDQTCFYPRGGGQDWDMGTINNFVVDEVRLDEQGVVHHYGQFDGEQFAVGDAVQCQVDAKRRSDNTRIHSAGHLIDMALAAIKPGWVPVRGAHFVHMSFDEYQVPEGETLPEALHEELVAMIEELAKSDYQNQIRFMDAGEMSQYCRHIPENLPTNKPSRVVLYADDFGIPCGGTHVKVVREIGDITITKMKIKKGLAKVSYAVAGIT